MCKLEPLVIIVIVVNVFEVIPPTAVRNAELIVQIARRVAVRKDPV